MAKKQPVVSADEVAIAEQDVRATRVPEVFAAAASARPGALRILAEGDSWLAYPKGGLLFGEPSNIVSNLEAIKDDPDLVIRDTSSNGDEAVAMLSGESKFDLLKRIAKDEYDVLLFSGGGNDIVGAYDFEFFLNAYQPGFGVAECVRMDRFGRRLQQIANAYRDLLDLAFDYSRNRDVRVVTHTYDIAKPIPQGAEFFGGLLKIDGAKSWMYPYLMTKGITDPQLQIDIVALLLGQFRLMLLGLAAEPAYAGRLTVVDTHGLIADGEWLNEIHPTAEGFAKVARKIFDVGLRPLANGPRAVARVVAARAASVGPPAARAGGGNRPQPTRFTRLATTDESDAAEPTPQPKPRPRAAPRKSTAAKATRRTTSKKPTERESAG